MSGKVGLQLFSVWRDAEKDFLGTIERVASLGYESVQFAGFFNTPAEKVKKVLDENRLAVAGAHVGINQLLNDGLEKTLEYHKKIENNLIVCPAIPKEMRGTVDQYQKTAQLLNQIGENCRKEGFLFGYHNHDFEFQKIGNKSGFEILFENTDPELVKMELDCYWASYAEQNPLEIVQNYQNRIISLHIKDLKVENGEKKGTEVGRGQLDFPSLIKQAEKIGIEWFTVEQEEFEFDPYESLAINADALKRLFSEVE
ncbi:sugar phosphate isomerase/epimerase [Neobacillus niacini]|uniref:sugar phosphate isomerase/epimerase family protein n=1 Tax=Neobacillus driksii TaxID=3035913 RepID=UPI00277FEB8C|nr:sugar phosphate isomerase/epimerase [Neobacillus niacini]MDQ0972538.1 sugar phosphate isomerase/epimerase [Neobacillus niacini]